MFRIFAFFNFLQTFQTPGLNYAEVTTALELATEDGVLLATEDGNYWGVLTS
jgi:hypothetical protein